MTSSGPCEQEDSTTATATVAGYWRAKAQDLITVTALKLQPRDTRELSPVALVKSVEQEIKGWAIAKPVLAARRLRKSGTRALRLYELTQVHDRLSSGTYRAPRGGLSRESHLVARANHTLDRDHNLWADVLPAD